MHLHVSLWSGPVHDRHGNARNLFVPHRADGAVDAAGLLSTLGQQFAAGVLAHAPALSALAAPTVNSYKRLAATDCLSGSTWVPAGIAHGPNNRTALLRTLHGRFEWRQPDASANPYLVSAALIAAGLDGIDRQLALPPAVDDDLTRVGAAGLRARGIGGLPRHLGEALDALAADAVLADALGETLGREFTALKRDEHLQHSRHVSDWELQRYAALF
jgi:glutamine synthetase